MVEAQHDANNGSIGESQAQTNCHEMHSACAFSTHNSTIYNGAEGTAEDEECFCSRRTLPISETHDGVSKAKSISLRSIADICWVAELSAPALLHRTPLLHKLDAQFRRQANA